MAQIRVKDLTFCYDGGIDNIFEDVSFSIDTDWRLGFIGRNGKGKTTFLNLLLGKYRYQGTIDAPSGFRYFPYLVTERQMGMEAWEFIDELEEGCELWQAARELADLGETDEILYRPFGSLSPGERTKILLAVLFAGNGGFFLIDEPTSHLDLEAREAVQTYLASKKGFIPVSYTHLLPSHGAQTGVFKVCGHKGRGLCRLGGPVGEPPEMGLKVQCDLLLQHRALPRRMEIRL